MSVNPFDQPGVESYKKNMFALLGKPGYEDRKAELEASLANACFRFNIKEVTSMIKLIVGAKGSGKPRP